MIKITKHLYIHSLLLPMILLAYFFGSQMTFFMSFGIVLVHELSHLITAIFLGIPVKSVVILPFGMTLRLSNEVLKNPKKEVLIAISGPLSNVLMIISGVCFLKSDNLNYFLFLLINWSVLLLNLIPVPPLDGGRILRAALIKHSGLMASCRQIRKISKVFIGIICATGVVLLIQSRGNPSLCIIGAFLIFSLIEEKKSAEILIMNSLIYEKEKFKNMSIIPTSSITVKQTTPAHKVIKKLNFSTFYIVFVVDENNKIIKTATESDFIRAVKSRGYSVLSKYV